MKPLTLALLALSGCSNAWAGRCCDRPVAMLGHSILAGLNVSRGSQPSVVVENTTLRAAPDFLAVSGSLTSGCVSRWSSRVSGGAYAAIVWQCAINDFLAGTSQASIESASQDIWDAALSQGLRVVINYEMPCNGYSGCDGTVNSKVTGYNTTAAAYCAAHPSVTACVDLYTQLGVGTALNAIYDSGDHLHPNATGSALIGALDAAELP